MFTLSLFAQQFNGVITNVEGKPIEDCYVLLINADTNEVIDYAIPNTMGAYRITIGDEKEITNVRIKCQGLSYNTQFKVINLQKSKKRYIADFILTEKEQKLDEVFVISERIAIKVKNDTVVFDVSKFKRSEDRKIINVLKNIPGIKADERTGLIQYKGKPIETILLDGDDLFGKGYSIGARNIPSDSVDKVEAIEDYHENKLKKGLKKSEKVVLNLKFKKDKFKLSGEVSAGFGKDSHLGNLNTINLSSRVKGFGVFNINNISINETSFQQDVYASENREEIENSSTDFFRESNITQASVFPRSYINNLKFGTFSNLFKIFKKVSFKNNISAFGDMSKYSYLSSSNININGELIQTSNETFNTAKPRFISFSNEIIYDMSKSSILKYQNRFINHVNTFNQKNLQNNSNLFETEVDHSKFYYQQKLNYTKKISTKELFEFNLFHSNDMRKQKLLLLNQQNIVIDGITFTQENTKGDRSLLEGKISYLRKIKRWDIEFTAKHTYDDENFNIDIKPNIFHYQVMSNTSRLITEVNYNKEKKIKITGKVELGYSDRELQSKFENETLNESEVFINAEARVKFKVGEKSTLTLNFENENKLNDNYYLFSNPILIDTRTITSSRTSFNFRETWRTFINFSQYNLFKQSSFSLLGSYKEERNSFLAEQSISEDASIVTYFQTPLTRKDISFSTSTSFFINGINNKVNLNANANYSRYFNALNGSFVREVWSSIYNLNLELNSAFERFFNYKSGFGLTYVKNEQGDTNAFVNSTINVRFDTIFKFAKKTYCKVENKLLLPKGNSITRNQLFIDFSFNHILKNIEYFILARNLLNKSSFNQIYTNEFSTSVFSNNLFDRYIVLGLNYSF